MTCLECGAPSASEFCCRAHEDLWTHGPSVQPGHSILRVEMGNTQPGEPGKRSKPKKWQEKRLVYSERFETEEPYVPILGEVR